MAQTLTELVVDWFKDGIEDPSTPDAQLPGMLRAIGAFDPGGYGVVDRGAVFLRDTAVRLFGDHAAGKVTAADIRDRATAARGAVALLPESASAVADLAVLLAVDRGLTAQYRLWLSDLVTLEPLGDAWLGYHAVLWMYDHTKLAADPFSASWERAAPGDFYSTVISELGAKGQIQVIPRERALRALAQAALLVPVDPLDPVSMLDFIRTELAWIGTELGTGGSAPTRESEFRAWAFAVVTRFAVYSVCSSFIGTQQISTALQEIRPLETAAPLTRAAVWKQCMAALQAEGIVGPSTDGSYLALSS